MIKRAVITFLLIVSYGSAFALITDIGIDPLDQAGSARPYGMGSAFTALGDINSLFYNPAGLAASQGIVASVNSIRNFSLGLAYGTGIGSVGLGFVYRNFNDFDHFGTKASYENDMALMAYGVRFGNFSLGIAAKAMLLQRLARDGMDDVSSNTGFDTDAGLQWQPYDHTSIGLVMHNISSNPYTIGSSDESFPRATRAGIAISLLGEKGMLYNETYGLILAYDAENRDFGGQDHPNTYLGAELSYNNWLFLRGGSSAVNGIGTKGGTSNVSSLGIGMKFGDLSVDLASFNDPLVESQVSYFSLSYSSTMFAAGGRQREERPKTALQELLIVRTPPDDFITYEGTIAVSGRVRRGGSVVINSVNAFVDENGFFNAVLQLVPGKNFIEIEGSDGSEKSVVSRKVLRKAKVVIAEEASINERIVTEILDREKELAKREESLKVDKARGIDVSRDEKKLAEDKQALDIRRAVLYDDRKRLDERKDKVENLVTLGVIEVSPDKSFEIESPMRRGEMIEWLVKAAGIPVSTPARTDFSDVPENSRVAPYVKAALDRGMIKITSDKRFRPGDPVTEGEAQEMFKAFGVIQ